MRYLAGELSANPEVGKHYNPEIAKRLADAESVFAKGEAAVKAHYNMPHRVQTVSVRLIERHIHYCRMLAKALSLKAVAKDEAAREAFRELWDAFNLYEMDMEANYDHSLCIATLNQIFKTDSHLPQEDEPVLNLDLH